jgi:hypothetical protein
MGTLCPVDTTQEFVDALNARDEVATTAAVTCIADVNDPALVNTFSTENSALAEAIF